MKTAHGCACSGMHGSGWLNNGDQEANRWRYVLELRERFAPVIICGGDSVSADFWFSLSSKRINPLPIPYWNFLLSVARSGRNLQLRGIKQQVAGVASFCAASVIADDDDALPAIDDGGAHAFSVLEAWQTWSGDTASRLA